MIVDTQIDTSRLTNELSDEYEIICSTTVDDAIEQLLKCPADLILLSRFMSETDSYAICETLHNHVKTKNKPILLINSSKSDDMDERFLELGVIDCIQYPFNITTVKNRLKNTLKLTKSIKKSLSYVESEVCELSHLKKLSALGLVMSRITHDINNPMTYVTGNLNFLKKYHQRIVDFVSECDDLIEECSDNLEDDESEEVLNDYKKMKQETIKSGNIIAECTEMVEDCLHGTDRIVAILKKLRFFSHQTKDKSIGCDIHQCLDQAITLINSTLKVDANITKKYHEIPNVTASAIQLGEVFFNILVNAIQAIDQNGMVSVSTCREKEQIVITISDDGCGMPKEIQDQIFEPFFSTKNASIGTGLSLSISHDIIQLHEGTLRVESEINQGSTFNISLPIK